tara:strand:- start:75 stop:608 length:534 start_codon:yes stop_codon:yes gene_type:complete
MSGGMVLVDVSGKASTVMTTKGDIVTYSTERVRKGVGSNAQILVCDSTDADGNKYDFNTQAIIIACSDETSDLTTGDDKAQIRLPYQFELTAISANVNTAPTGSTISIQVQEAGSDILSTPITIDISETSSETAAVPPVISDSTLAANSIISIDLDQIGSTVAGTGLKINLIGYRVV